MGDSRRVGIAEPANKLILPSYAGPRVNVIKKATKPIKSVPVASVGNRPEQPAWQTHDPQAIMPIDEHGKPIVPGALSVSQRSHSMDTVEQTTNPAGQDEEFPWGLLLLGIGLMSMAAGSTWFSRKLRRRKNEGVDPIGEMFAARTEEDQLAVAAE